jgi:hypothetical protein
MFRFCKREKPSTKTRITLIDTLILINKELSTLTLTVTRCIGHDVSLCSIGALAFYIVMRFHITKETIYSTDNKSWFNRKLLIMPTKGADLNQEMVYSHYGKVLEKIRRKLEIKIAKFKHFGRLYGQMDGEIKDMDEKDLDHVRNWNGDSSKKHNSLKITFHGIRQLAGRPKLCGLAHWERSVCDTSELLENGKPLQKMIFSTS